MIEEATRHCPYCGEAIALVLDLSAGSQDYVEDCSVCCQPMRVRLTVQGRRYHLELQREND